MTQQTLILELFCNIIRCSVKLMWCWWLSFSNIGKNQPKKTQCLLLSKEPKRVHELLVFLVRIRHSILNGLRLETEFFLLRVQFSLMKCRFRKLKMRTCFTSPLHHGHVIIIVPSVSENTLGHTYNE